MPRARRSRCGWIVPADLRGLLLALVFPLALLAGAPAGARAPEASTSRAGTRAGLPPGLLAAGVWHESRGRNLVRLHRHGCDVGPAQVYVRGCSTLTVAWMLSPRANLAEGARILATSARTCRADPRRLGCRWCIWGRYNPRSPGWCAAVLDRWRRPDA